LAAERLQVKTAELRQPTRAPSVTEIRQQAVKNWLEFRGKQNESEQARVVKEEQRGHGRDEDLTR